MICPRCGKINKEDVKICSQCSDKLYIDPDDTPEILRNAENDYRQWQCLGTFEIDSNPFKTSFLKKFFSLHPINLLKFSRNGKYIIFNGKNGSFRILDPENKNIIKTFEEHTDEVTSLAVSPDGKFVASASLDKSVKVRLLPEGKVFRTFTGDSGFTIVRFLSDSATLLTVNRKMEIRCWDIETSECIKVMKGHTREITSLAVSPDEKHILSGSLDADIKIWNTEKNISGRAFMEHCFAIRSISFHPGGNQVTSLAHFPGKAGRILVWDFKTGRILRRIKGDDTRFVLFDQSPDGTYVVTVDENNLIEIWNQAAGNYICRLGEHKDRITSVTFSPDGSRLATGDESGIIRVWG